MTPTAMEKRKQQHILFCHLFCSEPVICETYHIQYSDSLTSLMNSICLDSRERNGEEEKKTINFGIISYILYDRICVFSYVSKVWSSKTRTILKYRIILFLIDGQFQLFRFAFVYRVHLQLTFSTAKNRRRNVRQTRFRKSFAVFKSVGLS